MAKVAWLCEYPLAGGGDRSLLATLPGLRAAGFDPVAIAPAGGELAQLFDEQHVPLIPIRWHTADGTRLSQEESRAILSKLLRHFHPDLLHANSLSMARLSGPVAAEQKLPSIGHLRDIVGVSARAMLDINLHTRLLAVSQATRQFHVEQRLAPEKSFVLHNGVDLTRFAPGTVAKPRPLITELNLPQDALLLGVIGQIIQRKGLDRLVPLAEQLQSAAPQAHLLLIGDRPSQKEEAIRFEADVRRELTSAAPGQVHFLGRRDDVHALLPQLDVLVHPARQEPLGRVLLEGAACGLPIVATAVGGTLEIFPPDQDAAAIVPAGDGEQLAAKVIELLRDPRRRSQLGSAARCRAESAFSADRASAALASHYAAVLRVGHVAADIASE